MPVTSLFPFLPRHTMWLLLRISDGEEGEERAIILKSHKFTTGFKSHNFLVYFKMDKTFQKEQPTILWHRVMKTPPNTFSQHRLHTPNSLC